MGDRTGRNSSAGGSVTAPDHPSSLRNVALVGPTGAGKTTLVDALAQAAGAIGHAGRVADRDTLSDHDELEHRQQRSIQLALVPVEWAGIRVNLIDTPGYADFVGELRAGLRAADAALFVVSAADGVDDATRLLWTECADVGMPRALVVTHLDATRANFTEMTGLCQEAFGGHDPDAVLPLYVPLYGPPGADGHAPVVGLTELLSQRVIDYSSDAPTHREPDEAERPALQEARNRLIEGIIAESEDETLMDRYVSGEVIDTDVLIEDLEKAVARGVFHPVLTAAPPTSGASAGLGTVELLELVTRGFPTPREHPLPQVTTPDGKPGPRLTCDPEGPLVAEVIKTSSDPYVGRVSLVRVFSGTLSPDRPVHVWGHGLADSHGRLHDDHDGHERVGGLTSPFGKHQRPLSRAIAGDLTCVARLSHAETGDTISAKDHPLLMAAWRMPDPLLPVPVRAHGTSDEDRFSQGLARLAAEDPALLVEHNPDTGQVVLWCLGEAHQEVALERLRHRFGVRVESEEHRVALRETFAALANGHGRHVKQSGGHGQFAICELTVEPLAAGSGVEFVAQVVGGAVPRQFIASVEKGVRAQAAKGLGGSGPLVDVRVTLRDGKAHSVDSSDAAFQTAGALALREAASEAGLQLLEPVAELTVTIIDDLVGSVMGDLASRRGRVIGTEQYEGGTTAVRADVPELELSRYAIDLRALAHGAGRFSRRYARHEPMPRQLAAKIREESGATH